MMVYVNHGGDDHDEGHAAGGLRFRSPTTPIDWLVIALDVVAVVAGSIALFGSSYVSDRANTVAPGDHAHELTSWRMAALPVVFSALVALSLVEAWRVRQVSSVLALGSH
jgi:TRAP-type C4-dicarboxylate transport system permease small subunit